MENQNKPGFDNLPHEIIQNILSRLPLTSLIRLGFVSRSWRTLAHDPHLANLHIHQTNKNNSCLTLISHNDHPNQDQLHFAELSGQEDEDECVVRNFQTPFSLPKFNVIGSCNGLLCLLNNNSIYIYNPFTRKYKELPECKSYGEYSVFFGFGFHPVTNEYKIVKIVYNMKSKVQINCIRDNTWRSIGSAPYGIQQQWYESVCFNGLLHWVSPYAYNLVPTITSFDLGTEHFSELPKPEIEGMKACFFQLVVLGGCLSLCVCQSQKKLDVWVMKEYGNQDSWVKKCEIESYPSNIFGQDLRQCCRVPIIARSSTIRVLGLMNNGEILLDYGEGKFALYNPDESKFKKMAIKGTVELFQPVLHYGTLNWIDNPLEM